MLPLRTNTNGNSCSTLIYSLSEYILNVLMSVTVPRREAADVAMTRAYPGENQFGEGDNEVNS